MGGPHNVVTWRQRTKRTLVELHGGKCVDCQYAGPAFMYDFDHRDPLVKEFAVGGNGITRALARQIAESLKCDLVCSNCHRMRTHIQTCRGCVYCPEEVRLFHRHKPPVVLEN